MTEAGLWIPRRQRPPKIYQPRARRACLCELIQIDGSDHRWFEDRAPACTLLVYVDDATSRLMALHFSASTSGDALNFVLQIFRAFAAEMVDSDFQYECLMQNLANELLALDAELTKR
ncbi:hypothetical protein PBP221_16120 [Paraburkholderia sp. 22B1P]|nr:hypothetical protein PBP221_16120 [Paraburkholderia sp. 22B1P]